MSLWHTVVQQSKVMVCAYTLHRGGAGGLKSTAQWMSKLCAQAWDWKKKENIFQVGLPKGGVPFS